MQTEGIVKGTATHRERIAIPATAELTVKLLDVSRQDAPAVTIGEQKIATGGKQVPFNFEIKYDPAAIKESNTYAVRAEIRVGDKLMFTTTEHYGVITRGMPTTVNLLLRRVGAGSPQKAIKLEETYWRLTELDGKQPVVGVREEASLRLSSKDNRFSGTAGCNRFVGGYKLDGEKIGFGQAAATMMACPQEIAEQEQSFKKLLQTANRYALSADTLSLYADDILLARFKAGTPPATGSQVIKLENTYWKLTELDGKPNTGGAHMQDASLMMNSKDRRFSGSGGCNRLMGGYTLDGDKLSFVKPAGTMMACPPEVMEQERAFIKMLESTTRYTLTGDILSLYANDALLAKFKAQKSPPKSKKG